MPDLVVADRRHDVQRGTPREIVDEVLLASLNPVVKARIFLADVELINENNLQSR